MAASTLLFPLAIRGPANHQIKARENIEGAIIRCSNGRHDSEALLIKGPMLNLVNRRSVIGLLLGLSCLTRDITVANAAGLPPEERPKLCDNACEKELENVPMVTTESGLQYKDIKVGQGPSPPIGFQVRCICHFETPVAAHYVAMVPSGQIFDSSLEKGQPYIFRVGSGQVIKGLDEGILTMKVGGLRRLYIPGPLAFPKGVPSAPGRPRVAPNSPVIFDVNLLYVPGLETEEE
ncbi:hypothetical protein Cgig2_024454 [Carnegiea gigantea]|uniref:peptidylprolyl isomerase n=1 Tax=Carnegiea gigantea TaxID=171969 RepID=A0A9Q1KM20_9CARY|nr:hypothetical protein Cgig2_024454 [Carnegiea gigantea]